MILESQNHGNTIDTIILARIDQLSCMFNRSLVIEDEVVVVDSDGQTHNLVELQFVTSAMDFATAVCFLLARCREHCLL